SGRGPLRVEAFRTQFSFLKRSADAEIQVDFAVSHRTIRVFPTEEGPGQFLDLRQICRFFGSHATRSPPGAERSQLACRTGARTSPRGGRQCRGRRAGGAAVGYFDGRRL